MRLVRCNENCFARLQGNVIEQINTETSNVAWEIFVESLQEVGVEELSFRFVWN